CALPALIDSSAGPAKTVPIARALPSGFGTLVDTRINSSCLGHLFYDSIDDIEVVVDLGRAEVEGGGVLAADDLVALNLGAPILWSSPLASPSPWPLLDQSEPSQPRHQACDQTSGG